MPEIFPFCVWAMELEPLNRTIKRAENKKRNNLEMEKRMCSPLSRLAREVKVGACPGSIPAFAIADSVGLLARRNCAAQPSRSEIQGSGLRGISPALQSRGGDGFTPSSRHGVCD